ncbi:bifunctional glutamate N-acetyltransferase/amino-acid acetyltransferase ArgJ [Garciella nitratireducens]|uniref:Arginine biosynthesis bifunctional protein ArgJ n=1 Tax=Garciella nitratireducens DSM 15102 TaxID=1121911 RepID=A0A1T4NYS2_9FIRM|nr:bifunctional glutamate N-acetyltransferase/amino-acid acetyltransferase ArgJ [Garciella nitratireducens]SJZ84361.1 glutamate N-acetyltransferase [Garciella nitratireducens DSM 15102]
MKILPNKTITDVSGFLASGIHSGIRKSGKKDLAVIYSEKEAIAAAALTTNKVKAAPVLVTMQNLKSESIQAIVVNSGVANACTGAKGIENAKQMVEQVADCLHISNEKVLVSSTGLIGTQLPMEKVLPGIEKACSKLSHNGGKDAAEAILTTDTFKKTIAVEVELGGKPVTISGIAKGSGMIHPNMATMLSFIMTNVKMSKSLLNQLFKESVVDSYNMISVDGDSSTNDMAIILANGMAENPLLDENSEDISKFKEALDFVNKELAKMIAKDGEGASKWMEVSLYHAPSKESARVFARSVVSSNLVKAAIFGSDANWGRIMCALGYADADCDLSKVDIFFGNKEDKIQVVKNGIGLLFDENKVKEILDQSFVNIIIDLKSGEYQAKAWGCDLTYEYVKISGNYRK